MRILLANPADRVEIDEKRERYFIKVGSRWLWSCIKKKNGKNINCFPPFFSCLYGKHFKKRRT